MPHRYVILGLLLFANLLAFGAAQAAPVLAGQPAGVLVAVVDSGVSARHGLRLEEGTDLVDGDADASDPDGHGTAVAAAVLTGCPGCAVLPVRVLSREGTAPWARVASGIVWAVDHGARVVNVSIAGTGGSPELRAAVGYAERCDVLVVAAAGNAADLRPAYPAAYESVVAVAAAKAGGGLHEWSSRGDWIDLAAPGCATLPAGESTAAACGTSFAAPLAAGLAALERALDPTASASAISNRLPGLAASLEASTARLEVAGAPIVGELVRATPSSSGKGARVRWFRCAPTAGVHDCAPVSATGSYRVVAADAGSTLVARLVTEPFGGLWLASTPRIAVSA
jgi:subtilisin family serine protease